MKTNRIMIAIWLVVALMVTVSTTAAQDDTPYDYINYLMTEVNALRAQNGLPPFTYNEQLSGAAFEQADWMIRNWSYQHVHGGSTPTTRAIAAGYADYEWCCSENTFLSINSTPEASLAFWIRSRPHYRQLLSEDFDEMGIGWAIGASHTGQVLVFGKRGNGGVEPEAPAVVEPAAPAGADGCVAQHRVSSGENLYRIALRYNTTMTAIATRNSITDYARIFVGDTLCIPSGSATGTTVSVSTTGVSVASVGQADRVDSDNWCHPGQPWGDGRCNESPDPNVRAHYWKCGWFKARDLVHPGC